MTIKRIYQAAFPHKMADSGISIQAVPSSGGARPQGRRAEARRTGLGFARGMPTSLGGPHRRHRPSADLTLGQGPLPFRLGTLGLETGHRHPRQARRREPKPSTGHIRHHLHKDGRFGNLNSGSAQFGRRRPQSRRARPGPDGIWVCLEVCPTTCTPSRADAMEAGMSAWQWRNLTTSGQLVRLVRGVYAQAIPSEPSCISSAGGPPD